MSESLKITDELKEEIGTRSSDLVQEIYQEFDAWRDASKIPNVKNEITLTSLFINKLVKPWKSDFNPTQDAIEFKPRKLSVKTGKAEIKVIPEDYRLTYLGQFMDDGIGRTPEDLPFARYILESVLAEIGQELNDETAWSGVHDADGTSAIDVADGWGTVLDEMITEGELTPIVTGGPITSSNAFTIAQKLVRAIPGKYLKKKLGLTLNISQAVYNMIVDELREMKILTGAGFPAAEVTWFPGFESKVKIKVRSWMGNTHRMFITPDANLVILSDATGIDLTKINVIQQMWGADLGIGFAIGFNFASNMIWVNDIVSEEEPEDPEEEPEDPEEDETPPAG